MNSNLHYNLNLPDELSTILEQDFWMLENVGAAMISSLTGPVKFAATTWIVIYSGDCVADINLNSYHIKGPTLVNVKSNQIMQPKEISDDLSAGVIVLSKRLNDSLFMYLNNSPLRAIATRHPVVPIPEEVVPAFRQFFVNLRDLLSDVENPFGSQALMYELLLFIHRTAYKCFMPYKDEVLSHQGRISAQFLQLVQENFRKERFLDFYADKLEISRKHLSRAVKEQTGHTAVDWIERYIILEAKVLLKSSSLNIQQISDELNFASQSFFGKYFKKITGMSPKEFRNS
ncbi:MAG: helix-turn-helix domain-containing protein [Muribaculaceae bacterium]|nr:helix-turn-helix domain-containing protein [Muribaculaceae bacterium]